MNSKPPTSGSTSSTPH